MFIFQFIPIDLFLTPHDPYLEPRSQQENILTYSNDD